MRKFWIVLSTLLKNDWNLTKGRKGKTIGLGLLVLVCMLPAMGLFYFTFSNMLGMFIMPAQMVATLVLRLVFILLSVLLLLTSLLSFPTIFYFSQSLKTLLPLPIPSWMIPAAYLVEIFLSNSALTIMFGAPLFAAWLTSEHAAVISSLFLFVNLFVLVPLINILLTAIVWIVIMRLTPFFANKERFNMIVSIITVIFGVTVALGVNQAGSFFDGSSWLDAASGFPVLQAALAFFFYIPIAVRAIVYESWLWELVLFAVVAGFFALFTWICSRFYLPSAMAMQNRGSFVKKRRGKDPGSEKNPGFFWSSVGVEWKMIYRNPAYVANLILGPFILPVVYGIIMYTSLKRELFFIEIAESDLHDFGFSYLFFAIGFIATLIFGSLGSAASSTCISRMGQSGLNFMKQIPRSILSQLAPKMVPGFILNFAAGLFALVVLYLLLPFPWWTSLWYIAGGLLAALYSTLLGTYIDILRPKLVWDNETVLLKRNTNTLIVLGGTVLGAALAALPLFFGLWDQPLLSFSISLSIVFALIGLILVLVRQACLTRL